MSHITEEIIKRRLLLDGDGMGDERKLNSLIKSYLNLVESEDSEENEYAFPKIFSFQYQILYNLYC